MRPLIILALALSACSATSVTEPATEEATEQPTASPTDEPTEEPTERPTPEPTATPPPQPASFEEQLAAAENIGYEELFRNSADHFAKDIAFRGQVLQVIGEPGGFEMRIAVTPGDYGFWDDPVYVFYEGSERFLEDDIVDFVGLYADVVTYESTSSGPVTIPSMLVNANGIKLIESGGS